MQSINLSKQLIKNMIIEKKKENNNNNKKAF